ncbi:hypothetical protein [Mastigocladopsis repens]|uniref:hypothetical protein n=1 Tax=Mastigocladopsis repens TaxID=221287 RepID=UPI0003187B66|nr:hypothetical protein [Mastigocladopsis repens]
MVHKFPYLEFTLLVKQCLGRVARVVARAITPWQEYCLITDSSQLAQPSKLQ